MFFFFFPFFCRHHFAFSNLFLAQLTAIFHAVHFQFHSLSQHHYYIIVRSQPWISCHLSPSSSTAHNSSSSTHFIHTRRLWYHFFSLLAFFLPSSIPVPLSSPFPAWSSRTHFFSFACRLIGLSVFHLHTFETLHSPFSSSQSNKMSAKQ